MFCPLTLINLLTELFRRRKQKKKPEEKKKNMVGKCEKVVAALIRFILFLL